MNPPIRDGSGNDIGAIRLGDGSEIAEVRTGAGDVLFSSIDVVEDFERANPISDYQGDTASFARSTDAPIQGNASLSIDGANSDSIASDSLSNLPTRGDRLEGAQLMDGSNRFQVCIFDAASLPTFDGYGFTLRGGNAQIFRIDANAISNIAFGSVGGSDGNNYYVSIEFNSSSIVYEIYNLNASANWIDKGTKLGEVTANDSTHDGGAFGFRDQDAGGERDPAADAFWLNN
jgi:hypothetical protein